MQPALSLVLFLVLSQADHTLSFSQTLHMVNVLFRHGDRTATGTLPAHGQSSRDSRGHLTKIGTKQNLNLGSYFQSRYHGFFSSIPSNEIKLESSPVPRCVQSAQALVDGLYLHYQTTERNFSESQLLPIYSRPHDDNMISFARNCSLYTHLYTQRLNTVGKQIQTDNQDFINFISNKTGVDTNLKKIWMVADTLSCWKAHNQSLPSWVNESVLRKLQKLHDNKFDLMFGSPLMAKLKGGPILKKIISNMNSVAIERQKPETKLYFYSGHDATVSALLNALSVSNGLSPPYAASVILELHQSLDQGYYVQVWYKNTTVDLLNYMQPPYQLTIPGCSKDCPYEKFVELTKDSLPGDWERECKSLHYSDNQHGNKRQCNALKPSTHQREETDCYYTTKDFSK
ncbi:lysosomal acid phosphatase isoform X1 [Octopus sinensis]|uniref:acid phosphatase n=1 Tax=Octopus sinensis TaxID=2607531 RepID=A0A6P7T5D4_9MOLL|nr:lysosomal acid phosphatase isoform X1 [Octopus sinensis]